MTCSDQTAARSLADEDVDDDAVRACSTGDDSARCAADTLTRSVSPSAMLTSPGTTLSRVVVTGGTSATGSA